MNRSWTQVRLVLAAAVLLVGLVGAPVTAGAQTNGIPSVGTDFAGAGPYPVDTTADGAHTFFHPTDPGVDGARHPVILWGNGTGTGPTTYANLLRHLASHGFVVAAANTPNAGSGADMLAGLDKLAAWNGAAGNRFEGAIDLDNVGATGHSQGAYGATSAGRDDRVDTVFPLQGGGGAANVRSALFFSGGADTIVSPNLVRRGYNATRVPAVYAELVGASHFTPINDGGGFRGPATAWARMELLNDGNARSLFRGGGCGLCASGQWVYETNAAFQAQPVDVPVFSDIAGDTHAEAIVALEAAGVVEGFSDGRYLPGLPVTRAQMAAFLARALDLPDASAARFGDVPADNTHRGAIGAIAEVGITTGYPDGTFRPAALVTREQMATMLVAAFDLPPGTGTGFPDVRGTHADAVRAIASAGIAEGYPDGTFRPGQAVTRGQMASFLVAALER